MAPGWTMVAELAIAAALLALGAVMAWSSANAAKRLAGVQIALLGGCVALAVIEAPSTLMLIAIAVALAHVALGGAIIVRLQEAHGGVEAPDIDSADKQSEPVEPDS